MEVSSHVTSAVTSSVGRCCWPAPEEHQARADEPCREPPPAAPQTKYYVPSSRIGLKRVAVGLRPQEHKQLKLLALKRETSVEALLREAVESLLASRRKGRGERA